MAHPETSVAVIGAGGHAKVVIATLDAAGALIGGVFDDDTHTWGHLVLGHRVLGAPDSDVLRAYGLAVIAIGDNAARATIADRFDVRWATVVHPRAWIHGSVVIEPGAVVLAGAVIQPEARLGRHVIVNTGATVDHDCRVDEFAHLCPGSHLAGSVFVGRGALVGVGAAVIPGRRVGASAVVGAGAVVIHDVPDGATAVGVPARCGRRP
jgi:sugar O-acyltransferase (sialic acid O-acetyltransferase NeuD family)